VNFKLLYKDAALTLLTQIITALSGVLIMFIISRGFGLDSYGEYYLVKRSSDVIWLFFLMGMTVSIPRNKAFFDKNHSKGSTEFSVLVLPLLSTILYILFSDLLMTFFLKDLKDELGLIVSMLVIGTIFYAILNSYLRAISKFILLNLNTLINFSVIPLTPLLFANDIITYLKIYSFLILLFNICYYIVLFFVISMKQHPFKKKKEKIVSFFGFLKYGILRLPGLFLASLIFTLPVLILNYLGSSEEIGSLGQVFQLFGIVSMPINALGIILLPNFSKVIAEGNRDSLQSFLNKGNRIIIIASTILALILVLSIEEVLYLINGEYIVHEKGIYIKVLILSIIPFSIYNFLRNPIDAAHETPYSTILVFASFIISAFISLIINFSFIISNFALITTFTSINLFLLGIGSLYFTYKLYFGKE